MCNFVDNDDKNDKKKHANIIIFYKSFNNLRHYCLVKKGQQIQAKVNPLPPFLGNAQKKKTCFFDVFP